MTDDKLSVPGVVLNGNQREFLAVLVRAQDHVTAADIEPPNHRLTVGARRHDLSVKLARIGLRAIDGHDRAGGQNRVHGLVGQSNTD